MFLNTKIEMTAKEVRRHRKLWLFVNEMENNLPIVFGSFNAEQLSSFLSGMVAAAAAANKSTTTTIDEKIATGDGGKRTQQREPALWSLYRVRDLLL